MKKSSINNERGMALAVVVMVFAVVAILATTTLSLSLSQTKQSVSAERQTEAYYVARSVTDSVSTDIINQIKELNNNIPNASSTAIEINNYNMLQAKVDSILTTGNVVVNGVGSGPVTSNLVVTVPNPGEKVVMIETSFLVEGRTGKAKVQLGKVTTTIETVTQSGVNTNAIYTWGNLNVGNGLTVTGGGSVGYGGTATIGNNSNIAASHSIFPIDIILPGNQPTKNSSALVSSKTGGSIPVKNLNSSHSGYYGSINLTHNNDSINWNVNTNNGDVVIVLNKLSMVSNDADINVSGTGNLYIYLVEDPSGTDSQNQLMYFKNNFNIRGKSADGAPLTYLISYTKKMQQQYALGNDTTTNSNVMPYDSAYIKNSSQLDAFIYLPGINLTIEQGNPKVTGSIFASQFTLGNSATVNFEPYAPGSVLATSTSMGETSYTVKKMEMSVTDINNLNKVWIK